MIISRELQLTYLMIVLTIFSILSTYIEHKKWHVINQASLAIIIGVFIGLLLYKSDPSENSFSQAFFYLLLPIIVFKEGYSLNKHHFFKNFFYIALYGIGGTLLNFVIIALLTTIMNNQGWITIQGSNNDGVKPIRPLSTIAILFYSACISSKDSVLVLQLLDFKKRPKLYSILFGEQMLNDLVVFSLQKAVESLQSINQEKDDIENKIINYLIFSGMFLEQILVSIFVGSIIGMTFTLITKQFRFLVKHKAICTALTIYSGYLSFAVCEAFGYSGVVSVLICGAYMSHYLTYNFSISSANSSKTTINTLAYISEAFIYIFLGYSASGLIKSTYTKNQQYTWSNSLILSQYFIVIPLARLLSLILTHILAIVTRLKTKKKWRINRYEFLVLFYSGLIRGPVAYALIQLFESKNPKQDDKPVITSTTEALVLLSTVLIAGSLNYVISWAFKCIEMDDKYHEDHPSVKERLTNNSSFYTESAIQVDNIKLYKQFTSKSQKFFQSFDENYMKPFMIYDYKVRKNDIKAAKKENQQIEKMIQKQEYDLFDDDVKKRRILNIEMVDEQNSLEIDFQDTLSQNKSLSNSIEISTEEIKRD